MDEVTNSTVFLWCPHMKVKDMMGLREYVEKNLPHAKLYGLTEE